MNIDELVTFGKYKGKSVSAMLADKSYCEWLMLQPWFVEKHQDIVALFVNGEQANNESPIHNALQANFLDFDFVEAFAYTLASMGEEETHETDSSEVINFEECGFDVVISRRASKVWRYHDGVVENGMLRQQVFVELKPSMGDDYPAVLRQIKTAMAVLRSRRGGLAHAGVVLLVGEFKSSAVSREQMVELFKLSGVIVIMLEDVFFTRDVVLQEEELC